MSSVTQNEITKHPRLYVALFVLLARMQEEFAEQPGGKNLSPIQMHMLVSLSEKDGQLASELAATVGRTATSFTPNLDALTERGLIRREPHPADRRAIRVFLTETGRRAVDGANEAIAAVEAYFEEHLFEYLPVPVRV